MQTTYTQDPVVAYPGMPADSGFKDDVSGIVEETNGISPGLLVIRGTGGDKTVRAVETPAADVDALITAHATAAAEQALTTADCNGALGAGPYILPAALAMTLSSHADWDATTATLVYEDENGVQQTESLAIPDGGNTTLTSTGHARRFVSLTIPAQSGTGGSYTVGVSADVTLDGGDVIGVGIRTHHARQDGSSSDAELYEDEATMPVRKSGRVYVEVENAFEAGDRVLARLVAGAGETLGAFRVGDTDGGDCVPWARGRLVSSGSAGDIGVLEIKAG